MCIRDSSIPVDLIANSLGAIFKNKASLELKSAGHAKESFQGTFVLLAVSGLIVFTGLFLTVDTLIPWLWGDEWASASTLLKTLLILYFFKYSIGPLTYIAQLASNQKEMFLINILVAVSIPVSYTHLDVYKRQVVCRRLPSAYPIPICSAYLIHLHRTWPLQRP